MGQNQTDPVKIMQAMECVEDFIDTGIKSMYFMDAWMTVRDFVEEKLKNEKQNK